MINYDETPYRQTEVKTLWVYLSQLAYLGYFEMYDCTLFHSPWCGVQQNDWNRKR